MWYFSWILGLGLACSFAILSAAVGQVPTQAGSSRSRQASQRTTRFVAKSGRTPKGQTIRHMKQPTQRFSSSTTLPLRASRRRAPLLQLNAQSGSSHCRQRSASIPSFHAARVRHRLGGMSSIMADSRRPLRECTTEQASSQFLHPTHRLRSKMMVRISGLRGSRLTSFLGLPASQRLEAGW